MKAPKILFLFIVVALLFLTACRAGRSQSEPASAPTPVVSSPPRDPTQLDRETVLSVARNGMNVNVEAMLEDCSCNSPAPQLYPKMIEAKVISCDSESYYPDHRRCKPGPNGQQFRVSPYGAMYLNIGRKVPSYVTGISRIDQFSATADVVLILQEGPGHKLFSKWQSAFQKYSVEDEQRRAYLRLYDDGWRVERFE